MSRVPPSPLLSAKLRVTGKSAYESSLIQKIAYTLLCHNGIEHSMSRLTYTFTYIYIYIYEIVGQMNNSRHQLQEGKRVISVFCFLFRASVNLKPFTPTLPNNLSKMSEIVFYFKTIFGGMSCPRLPCSDEVLDRNRRGRSNFPTL